MTKCWICIHRLSVVCERHCTCVGFLRLSWLELLHKWIILLWRIIYSQSNITFQPVVRIHVLAWKVKLLTPMWEWGVDWINVFKSTIQIWMCSNYTLAFETNSEMLNPNICTLIFFAVQYSKDPFSLALVFSWVGPTLYFSMNLDGIDSRAGRRKAAPWLLWRARM